MCGINATVLQRVRICPMMSKTSYFSIPILVESGGMRCGNTVSLFPHTRNEDFDAVWKGATAGARVLHETASAAVVLAVARRGPGILNRISPRLPHVEASPWKMARNTYTVV